VELRSNAGRHLDCVGHPAISLSAPQSHTDTYRGLPRAGTVRHPPHQVAATRWVKLCEAQNDIRERKWSGVFYAPISNVVGIPLVQIKIGMPVKVFFEPAGEEIFLPKFHSADEP
jgi:hypothetical protein